MAELFLEGIRAIPERVDPSRGYPFTLPFVDGLDLKLRFPITFFVGENGSGKSTLLEAVATAFDLPAWGGGGTERAEREGPVERNGLKDALRIGMRRRPRETYYFRGEFAAYFAALLDRRKKDPDFIGDPYRRYGGRSLRERSHGEGFFAVLSSWVGEGLFLLDEPEAALSPMRQIALANLIRERARNGDAQFLIATHSPILLTIPGAETFVLDERGMTRSRGRETEHVRLASSVLGNPQRFWREFDEPSDE